MYAKNDKRRLYELIEMYLSGSITASAFCDEFYYSYCLEINFNAFTKLEQECFSELEKVSRRFSPYKADHKLDPFAFSTEAELKKKIIETISKLQM